MDSRALLRERFGPGADPVVARAPGRVNIIGEHTDYNGGYVLPFAIDRYTEVALRPREGRTARVYSAAFAAAVSFELDPDGFERSGRWEDYIKGIVRELFHHGELRHGFDAAIAGNVPVGAGLSSSASLEVAFALGLSRLYGIELAGLELVTLCQRAEQGFVGTDCGIMDQYVAFYGEEGAAILLDTSSLAHRCIPLSIPGTTFLVVDSGVRRALARSGYNDRRRERAEALAWLRKALGRELNTLSEVTPEELVEVKGDMPPVLWRRAMHVAEENRRVLRAATALERGDPRGLGALLFSSHASLRDLFEVSTPELDFLVEWAADHGALGARLIGGGFGGATLHLVPGEAVEAYVAELSWAYRRRTSAEPRIFTVRPGPGAGVGDRD